MEFKDSAAVITGAASGMGEKTALTLAERGANVVVVDMDEDGLYETVSLVEDKTSSEVVPVVADVSKEEDVKQFTSKAIEELGKIDILHNNAGVSRNRLQLRRFL